MAVQFTDWPHFIKKMRVKRKSNFVVISIMTQILSIDLNLYQSQNISLSDPCWKIVCTNTGSEISKYVWNICPLFVCSHSPRSADFIPPNSSSSTVVAIEPMTKTCNVISPLSAQRAIADVVHTVPHKA